MEKPIRNILIIVGVLLLIVVLFFESDLRTFIYNYFSVMGVTEYKMSSYRLYNFIAMLFVMIVSALIGHRISKKKRRNQILWTALCFIFNIWAVIILWFLPVLTSRHIKEMEEGVGPP